MTTSVPTCSPIAINIAETLSLLEKLEGIKATSSFYENKAVQALEVGSDFYSTHEMRLNLKRNELIQSLDDLTLGDAHSFVIERYNDTSRAIFRLCQILDNKGGSSITGKMISGTMALASKFSLSISPGEPTKFTFTEPATFLKPSRFCWINTSPPHSPIIQFIESPEFNLTPTKNLTPLFKEVRKYWKSIKPILYNNVASLLKGKIRLSLVLKYPELEKKEDWGPHVKTISEIEKFLPILINLKTTMIHVTNLFSDATNAWTQISKLPGAGIDTITEAAIIATFDKGCYLKLTSMKVRLLALTTLVEDRTKRYKEECNKP